MAVSRRRRIKGRNSFHHKRRDWAGISMVVLSGIFIILSFAFSTSALTGNAIIQNMSSINANFTGLGCFLIGILLAFAYLKGRR